MTSRDYPMTLLVALGVLSAMMFSPSRTMAEENSAALAARFGETAIPFLQKHCLACHGEKEPKADLSLVADRDAASVVKRRDTWESVLEMVESGQMPPNDKPKPDPVEIEKFVSLVKAVFDDADRNAKPDPGRVTVRRLNRVEYNHTIRDLMGVDFDAAEDFPSDDIGHGFDNIGDVLTVSPVLMERYLAAAESIVQKAILVGDPPKPPKRHLVAQFLRNSRKQEPGEVPVRSLDGNGNFSTVHKLTVAGDYILRFRGWGRQVGEEPVKVTFQVGDKELETVEVTATDKDKKVYEAKPLHVEAGDVRVAVNFVNEFEDPNIENADQRKRTFFVQFIEFEGPLDMMPPSHRMLLACAPDKPKPDQTREVLNRFLSRAYRRPATKDEVERLVVLATLAQDDGLSWEAAMQRAFMAVLVSPKFLFRLELDNRPDSPEPRPLDEFQLASRLSYFLWSTMPDDELFDLAGRGELTKNLDAQVRRMLADPKSKSLVDNFAMQWLQLQRLKMVSPDKKLFPSFDERLRFSMQRETELFVDAIIREDRSVLDLLDADFTFLNYTLAQHYGIADTMGNWMGQKPERAGGQQIPRSKFVRVSLPHKLRGGLLTQASILTVTSNPTRTSPVKRGRWILEQILGAPPPPPPANVPELPEGEKAQLTGSLRQRMEQHRANPACANCHAKMDPIGFALENYDAIGAFRTKDGEFPIETAGVLPDGKAFQGPAELKSILKEKRNQFTRCLTEKLLIYALGRGLEYYDRRPVMKIQEALAKNDFKFSVLVTEIVKSDPFRLRRGSN